MRPYRRQPTRLPCPWDSPGKNTGVGCHFLLQCMKVKNESEVSQSCLTLATPWTAAYQAPPSMGFSRQKYWSGMPLPSPQTWFNFDSFEGLNSYISWRIWSHQTIKCRVLRLSFANCLLIINCSYLYKFWSNRKVNANVNPKEKKPLSFVFAKTDGRLWLVMCPQSNP